MLYHFVMPYLDAVMEEFDPPRFVDMATKINNQPISLKLLSTLAVVHIIDRDSSDTAENLLKLLPLPICVTQSILIEFEYQVDLYFNKYIEPHIEYKYRNEYEMYHMLSMSYL